MARYFTRENPPKSGISAKLWDKFTAAHFWYDGNEKPAGTPPDHLIAIQPGYHQRCSGAASYQIEWKPPGVRRAEILIWSARRALAFPLDGAKLQPERSAMPGNQYWIDTESEEA